MSSLIPDGNWREMNGRMCPGHAIRRGGTTEYHSPHIPVIPAGSQSWPIPLQQLGLQSHTASERGKKTNEKEVIVYQEFPFFFFKEKNLSTILSV